MASVHGVTTSVHGADVFTSWAGDIGVATRLRRRCTAEIVGANTAVVAQAVHFVVALRLTTDTAEGVVCAWAVVVAHNGLEIAGSGRGIAHCRVARVVGAAERIELAHGSSVGEGHTAVVGARIAISAGNEVRNTLTSLANQGVAGIGANAFFGSESAISGRFLATVVRAEVVVIASHWLGATLTSLEVANLRSAKGAAWARNGGIGANAGVADVVSAQVAVRAVLGGVGAAIHSITHSWVAKIGGVAEVCVMGAVGSAVEVHVARVISARVVVVT